MLKLKNIPENAWKYGKTINTNTIQNLIHDISINKILIKNISL